MSDVATQDFAQELQQRVLLDAEREELPLPAAFTDYMRGVLAGAGEIEDGETALYSKDGRDAMLASGFCISDDRVSVDIFVTDYQPSPSIRSLGKTDVASLFRKLKRFAVNCQEGLASGLEESMPAWDMASRLGRALPSAEKVRLTLLTNARVKSGAPAPSQSDWPDLTFHVWDVDRLYRLETSGREREPIVVDLDRIAGEPLPALGPRGVVDDYKAFLLLIPGSVLADIYEEYGARLLELNVRSFLQARGKVNRGIQQTIKDEPHRFLAYNNGISMTAASVDLKPLPTGETGICRIHDLQIVNGGQTTASLYHAKARARRDANPLDGIFVQAKLSVVPEGRLKDLVPRISEFANSQNTVKTADFSANDPFHVELEKLSRTIWAPAKDGSQRSTRWFYERARGQYADALSVERTPARQRAFKELHPVDQKFTKTDLAKYEMTWSQRPYLVALGAERCFREFTLKLGDKPEFKPDSSYFEQLVAKAILFRSAEKIIGGLGLGGYRSQTVTYTLALLSRKTSQQLDLGRIWRQQALSEELEAAVQYVSRDVHRTLVVTAGSANIAEWAKKEAAWQAVQSISWESSEGLIASKRQGSKLDFEEKWTPEAKAAAIKVMSVNAAGWDALLQWGSRSRNLDAAQRKVAVRVRDMQRRGGEPTPSLMVAGTEILALAEDAGFSGF
ncbi:AIPR family protein [Micromonospora sp. NPDC000089]|uniref:AIPR family protein n=1 Tax=unclassified Micromonospora TaxID=2617518 RepID=UPI003689D040